MNSLPEVYGAADLAEGGEVFKKLSPPARLCIFGDPVAQSASPWIQNAALKARGLDLQYVRIRVTATELSDALLNLIPAGFLGASLTMPHKQAALPLMDQVDREARLMGAINTVVIRGDKLHGHNTDGPGFSAAVRESFAVPLSSLRVLILGGSGGAGRAITVQCALEGCPSITVANRNREKGDALSSEIREALGKELHSIPLSGNTLEKALSSSDLIINATPLGMKPGDPSPLPEGLIVPDHLVYDTIYSAGETPLLRQAREAGARCTNGFSMLLHQGVLQNALWFGEPVPVETMRQALEELRR